MVVPCTVFVYHEMFAQIEWHCCVLFDISCAPAGHCVVQRGVRQEVASGPVGMPDEHVCMSMTASRPISSASSAHYKEPDISEAVLAPIVYLGFLVGTLWKGKICSL